LRVIRELLGYQPKGKGTDLAGALEAARRIMKHSGVVVIISDFLGDGYQLQLKQLARRHDVVAAWISDQRETDIPNVGMVLFENPETGEEYFVDTGSYGFKNWFDQYKKKSDEETKDSLKGGKVQLLKLSTQDDYGEALVRFFRARNRKRG